MRLVLLRNLNARLADACIKTGAATKKGTAVMVVTN